MALKSDSRKKFNLNGAQILLVEGCSMALEILVQILSGFGAKEVTRAQSLGVAKTALLRGAYDLVVVGAVLGEDDGCELVEWIRREGPQTNRYAPILMVSPHTPQSKVERARDCGAHFIIAKPLSPIVILERILWVAQEQRKFVTCDIYTGPDRRFQFTGPPAGADGRRRDDLHEPIGEPSAPNMSQDQIDSLINGQAAI